MGEIAPLKLTSAETDSEPRESPERTRVLDALSEQSPRGTTDVAARAGMSVAEVQSVLGALELDGVVREADRGWLKPAPKKAART